MKFYNYIVMVVFLFVSVAPLCAKSTKKLVFLSGALSSASSTMSSWGSRGLSGVSALSNETKIAVGSGLALLTGGYFAIRLYSAKKKCSDRASIAEKALKESCDRVSALGTQIKELNTEAEHKSVALIKKEIEDLKKQRVALKGLTESHDRVVAALGIQKKKLKAELEKAYRLPVLIWKQKREKQGLPKTNINIDVQNKYGYTALLLACSKNEKDKVKSLLKQKANVNITNIDQVSPLMFASYLGYDDIVALLLDYEPDLYITDKNGRTALMFAVRRNRVSISTLLINKMTAKFIKESKDTYNNTVSSLLEQEIAKPKNEHKKTFLIQLQDLVNAKLDGGKRAVPRRAKLINPSLLEQIKGRPLLKKASAKKLKEKPKKPVNPRNALLDQIKAHNNKNLKKALARELGEKSKEESPFADARERAKKLRVAVAPESDSDASSDDDDWS